VSLIEAYRGLWTGCSTLIPVSDEVNGFNMLGNESTDAPERAGPSTGLYTDRPAQLPLPPLATFTGPIAPPVPTLSWGCKCSSQLRSRLDCLPTPLDSPLPTETYTCTGNDWSNVYSDQPPAVQNLYGQWPHPTSVGKGNARATDDIMTPIHPITTGNTGEQASFWVNLGKLLTFRNSMAIPTAIRLRPEPANGKPTRSFC